MELKTFTANEGVKLEKALISFGFNYKTILKALKNKDVKVNGKRTADGKMQINKGDRIEIYYLDAVFAKKHYSVVFKDDNLLVIDKFSGITSEDVYKEILVEFSGAFFIHRLDRNTSGLMVFALNCDCEKELLKGFKERRFKKLYFAEVVGKLPQKQAVLTAYLFKDSVKSEVFVYDKYVKGSVEIKTGYKVLNEKENSTDIEVELFTGKTHQIRAHMAHIGHPIVGDGKYGDNKINKSFNRSRQMLVSWKLTLSFEKQSPLSYLNGKEFISKLLEEH